MMRLPKDVKVTLDALYASLVEIRLEEVVKPRMEFLGPVKVKQRKGKRLSVDNSGLSHFLANTHSMNNATMTLSPKDTSTPL